MSNIKIHSEENILGVSLRKVRKERGLTQEQVAKILKLSKSYLSSVEKGKRTPSELVKSVIDDWIHAGADQRLIEAPLLSGEPDQEASEAATSKTPDIDKLLRITEKVLRSNTIYKKALESNIIAFGRGLDMEEELGTLSSKMDKMAVKHASDMEELKALILSSKLPEKKSIAS